MLIIIISFFRPENDLEDQTSMNLGFRAMSNSNQYYTFNMVLCARCINLTMSCAVFQHLYYHKRGEGGGQKVMIGIIISENVDNYGWPLTTIFLYKSLTY